VGFVHLHVHSEFSLSSSLVRLESLVKRCQKLGMPAVALTDRGNLYGALYHWKACKSSYGKKDGQGNPLPAVKPIYGLELGVRVDGTAPAHAGPGTIQRRDIVLLAENEEGFRNLSRLSTAAHIEHGFEGEVLRPWVPLDLVLQHNRGLIALTGGLKGILSSFLLQDQEKIALETLEKLKKGFGEKNLFLELVDSQLSPQMFANDKLREWGKRHGLGLAAAADVYYTEREDAFAQEVWMMVSQKLTLEDSPRSSLVSQEFHLKSPEEMREAFSHLPEACDNTLAIAERCNVKISFEDSEGKRIFHLPTLASAPGVDPAGTDSFDESSYFAQECRVSLDRRLPLLGVTENAKQKIYRDRLEYEIGIIQKMGFAGYYLIVSDFIRWAKKNGIPVGPGRGSGAGSLAAFVLDITNIDPIAYDLLFERFLNPERVSLPDFDIDFCQARRHEVIKYVAEKYGQDRVCQIVTFAKEQSKNALKDVGRVLGLSFAETNRLTKLIPVMRGKPLTIQEAIDEVDEFKQLLDQDPRNKQVVEVALKIEGALRQPGVHAAGVIIASKSVADIAPLSRDVNGNPIVQWDMKMSEEAGLVKFDFLGLVTLDLLDLACRMVNERQASGRGAGHSGAELTDVPLGGLRYDNIPLNNAKAFELIKNGDTNGVFQFESSGMQALCKKIKPDKFAEVSAITSLFRPGPLESGMVDDYAARKFGRAKVEYMFPEMEAPLKDTYGTILYQEQVLEIARRVAGFSLGGADLLRRAMGKKIAKEMEAQRSKFVDGAVASGKPASKAAELFDLIEKFAGYGFNKSHADAYSVLTLQTAYLKANYPSEFFAALLSIEKGDTDKLAKYIQDARVRGLQVLPPDVNESGMDFTIVGEGVIRFGLSAIKNVGESAVQAILDARVAEAGAPSGGTRPFTDLFDFLTRVDLARINKRTVESLVQAGAMDFGENDIALHRGKYLATLEKALEWANAQARQKEEGQFSLFGGGGGDDKKDELPPPRWESSTLPPQRQLLDWEKQLLGIYVSGTPLDKYLDRATRAGAVPIASLADKAPKSIATLACLVVEFREVRVKKGKRAGEAMGIAKLEDSTGSIEMVCFPDHYKEYQALLRSQNPLLVRAELDFEEDMPKLLSSQVSLGGALAVEDLNSIADRWPKKVIVTLALDRIDGIMPSELLVSEIAGILVKHHGPVPVALTLRKTGQFETKLDLGEKYNVHPEKSLLEELVGLSTIPGSIRVDSVY